MSAPSRRTLSRTPLLTRLGAGLSILALAGTLSACGQLRDRNEPPPGRTTAAAEPSESPTESSTATPSPTISDISTSSSSSTPTSTTSTSSTTSAKALPKDVEKVAELYKTIAPREFFEGLESCGSGGKKDSYLCSGHDGQFQFDHSDSRAASTTQALTELRNSRVVEDTGSRIVGYSAIASTTVITVIDNDRGLIMQEMLTSDKTDPETRIRELGLVKEDEDTPSSSAKSKDEDY